MTQQELPVPEEAAPDVGTGRSRTRWQDPGIASAYVNAFTISATRDEIVLLFGLKQALQAGADELTVQVSDRILLTPQVAHQLFASLNRRIAIYESEYGPLDNDRLPPVDARPGFPANRARTAKVDSADEEAKLLFDLMNGLKVKAGYERSIKLSEGSLLGNRFLLGLSKQAIGPGADREILDICTGLQMPQDFLSAFGARLPDANYVHFGFEENQCGCLYKVYLEFWRKIEERLRGQPERPGPFLLHLGFKWDASDSSRCAITRYTWHPWLAVEDIQARASGLLDPERHRHTLDIVSGMLRLASGRIPHHDILYLEVTEDGNPRRSFDINMYRANLRVAELYPLLLQMGRQYSIPFRQLQAVYEPIKHKTFGHVSGGIDRGGKDFLTVYYGVEGFPGSRIPSGFSVDGALFASGPRQMAACPGKPASAGVETTDEKASRLYQSVLGLNVRVGIERSFKFLENVLLGDRFLMGVKRSAVGQDTFERLLEICRQIEMPENFLETFRAMLPEASLVLFGFEKDEKSRVYKAYLEFGDRLADAMREGPDASPPVHIHTGFKWDASDNIRSRMTRYTCIPGLTVDDMLRRIWDAFYRQKDRRLILLVEGIADLAATRAGPSAFLYLEAAEDNNPRSSFDINMYRANLRMEELYPLLLQVSRYYSIPSGQFHELYEPVKTQIFGHLTGGRDKDGKDFLTIYFGEKGSSR